MERQCKYGDNCPFLQKGHCKFSHSNGGGQNNRPNNRNNYGGGGGNRNNPNYKQDNPKNINANFNPNYNNNNPNYNNPNYNNNNSNFNRNYDDFRGNQGNQNMGFNNNRGPNSNQPKGDQFQNQFCKSFQLGQQCKYQQKCKKLHAFTLDNTIKRLIYNKAVPNHKVSKISTFVAQQKRYFALRMGHQVIFFEYDFIHNQLNDVGFKYSLPDANVEYYYYSNKNQYIYYASQNKLTSYHDFGIYDIFTQKVLTVQTAHQNKITGILHLNQQIILSVSLDGCLKVWKLQGDKLVLDKPSTDHITQSFNIQNLKIELLFIDKTEIGGISILTVGTSDARLLFWIGNEMTYKQAVLDNKFTRIFGVKYISFGEASIAMIMAWAQDHTSSALIALNLSTFASQPVITVQTDSNHPRQNISIFESVGNLLLVGNSYGMVDIYKIPDFKNRVGSIYHTNSIGEMLVVENMTDTGILTRNLFILENLYNKEGSLAVYLCKD